MMPEVKSSAIPKKNIGFVSTRFAGIDGVSMESAKWAQVLEEAGYDCFWFAGELDRELEHSFPVPEAHFNHPDNRWINERIFGCSRRERQVTEKIHSLRVLLKQQLREFIERFDIDVLIPQNALAIPMHIPLGIALTETLAELQLPTIAHHHDFVWERDRFAVNAAGDFLRTAFPPHLPNMAHVVINSAAQEELALRAGVPSIIIPNVLDFQNPPAVEERKTREFKRSIGLECSDRIILQPTRVVARKGIEHSIELVKQLDDPRYKLVISHEAGDEGLGYVEWLRNDAREAGVDLRLLKIHLVDPLTNHHAASDRMTLWDIYPHADFITYTSIYEGFGNALLEAIYFKKPLLVNRYSVFVKDIEPKGFDLVTMDAFLTKQTVDAVKQILESPQRTRKMVEFNYGKAVQYYSYAVLRHRLSTILANYFGIEF